MKGTLYGIGVGPGDPELITMKAVRVLERVDVVFAACSTKNEYSVAHSIAEPYLAKGIRVERLGFPMTRDEDTLAKAWKENADRVNEILSGGENAAFLTLGDPLLYSTFGYLLRTIREHYPETPVEIIPGITSFQAAAARTGTILTESGENLMIISGVAENNGLGGMLSKTDNAIIMKTYRNFDHICDVLGDMGHDRQAVLVSHCGLENERVERNIQSVRGEKVPYLSLMIVKKNGVS